MLSTKEIQIAADAELMFTKNRIIGAVYELFGQLAETYTDAAKKLPEALVAKHPKISKGENYLGLPWVMLDYPRNFANPDIFAVRTMFWWGNYFSLQLVLKGKFMQILNFEKTKSFAAEGEWFFCTGATIWQHHFEESYMLPVSKLAPEIFNSQKETGFYKIGAKLPVAEWDKAGPFFIEKIRALLFAIFHEAGQNSCYNKTGN